MSNRLRHLVYVLGLEANLWMLPSLGIWLNAFNSESRLDIMIPWKHRISVGQGILTSCYSIHFIWGETQAASHFWHQALSPASQWQVGSLTGMVHLSKGNAGALRRAKGGQQPPMEQKGNLLDLAEPYKCHKSCNRNNWLVAAKRPMWCCPLILQCCSSYYCSPTNRACEVGLKNWETG